MPRILVVDDQTHVRAVIKLALEANGFEVVAVETGLLGLNEFKSSKFDLAIVDFYMPGMDGAQLIKALRELKPDLPVVAISGMIVGSGGRAALDHFSSAPEIANMACLQKPFRPNELLAAIDEAIDAISAATLSV